MWSYWPTTEDCFHLCEDGIELLICESEVVGHLFADLTPVSYSIGSYERKDNWISVAETPVCPRSGTML